MTLNMRDPRRFLQFSIKDSSNLWGNISAEIQVRPSWNVTLGAHWEPTAAWMGFHHPTQYTNMPTECLVYPFGVGSHTSFQSS